MAGLKVVVVKCTDAGDVDIEDVRAKIAEHGPRLAAIMLDLPSTHGVFETRSAQICEHRARRRRAGVRRRREHERVAGAGAAARSGRRRLSPALHKTFCIPHGGGGPGSVVAVRSHLAPFLPGHPLVAGRAQGSGSAPGRPGACRIS